jgi:hypothetical protein
MWKMWKLWKRWRLTISGNWEGSDHGNQVVWEYEDKNNQGIWKSTGVSTIGVESVPIILKKEMCCLWRLSKRRMVDSQKKITISLRTGQCFSNRLESDTFGTEITSESSRLRVQQIRTLRTHGSKRYAEILSFVHRNYLFAPKKVLSNITSNFLLWRNWPTFRKSCSVERRSKKTILFGWLKHKANHYEHQWLYPLNLWTPNFKTKSLEAFFQMRRCGWRDRRALLRWSESYCDLRLWRKSLRLLHR